MDMKVLIVLLLAHPTLLLAASREYHVVSQLLNWNQAQSYCREKFLDLATIGSVEERDRVTELIAASGVTASHKWIGLSTGNQWKWSIGDTNLYDGSTLGSWFVFTKDNYQYQEHCAMMNQSILYDVNCELLLKSVCYDEPTKSYIPVTTPMTWLSAQSYCRETYTDLTSMRNQQEKDNITSVIDTESVWWVGLYKERWSWSDQSNSSYRSWAPGEPKGSTCASIWGTRNWDDIGCGGLHPFVCSASVYKILKIVMKTEGSVDLNDTLIHGAVRNHIDKLLKDESYLVELTWRKTAQEKVFFFSHTTPNMLNP